MPRRAKPPRLLLRPARGTHPARWVILDTINGRHEESTGCGEDDRAGAGRALEAYLARKHVTIASRDIRDPSEIPVADVLALYARDVAPGHARPEETAQRINALLTGFDGKVLAQINGEACREYAKTCETDNAARRQLEDLRAAINHHRAEGHCSKIVGVWLPPKALPRERWLTRKEAAKFIRKAWRARQINSNKLVWSARQKKDSPNELADRRTSRHVAKFTLVGLYTGSRAGRICAASFYPMPGRGFVDVEKGLFYRRPPGERTTNKRAPPVPLPPRLLAHLRRWKRLGQRFVVEWDHKPVKRVSKSFARIARLLGLVGVMPHTLRHTAATWLMQSKCDPWVAAGFLGMSHKTLIDNYGHHHPDYMAEAKHAIGRKATA